MNEILQNQIMVCQACQATNRFPISVTEGMLPVKLLCPKCMHSHALSKLPSVLPKVVPHHELTFWTVTGSETVTEDSEDDSSGSREQSADSGITSFHVRASQISHHLVEGMKLISILRTDIDNFEQAMFKHMSEEKRIALAFGRWDGAALKAFVMNPIASIQIGCSEDLMQQYSRLIISPAFYMPRCGFLLSDAGIGGMIVEVMNPYSRLSFPITDTLAEQIGVPVNLDLSLIGNKIVGSSLPYCYKEIPGTVEDGDHTLEHPSISIQNLPEYGYLARIWLAQHGVQPWIMNRIRDDLIRFNEPLGEVMQDEGAKVIWKKFKRTGRTAVFASNVIDARRMVAKVVAAIKGLKVVMYGSEDDRATWSSLYPLNINRDIAYMGPEDQFSLSAIKDVLTVVVDNVHQIEPERLIQLYGYKGYLIVIGDDPLLDFAEENDSAALIHSLVVSSCFDIEAKKPRSRWGSAVNQALRKLQGLKPLKPQNKKGKLDHDIEYMI